MYALPLANSAAREMFDDFALVEINDGRRVPLAMPEARGAARRFFKGADAARRAFYFVLLADDRLALVSFGRRLGHKIEWVFGAYQAPRKGV